MGVRKLKPTMAVDVKREFGWGEIPSPPPSPPEAQPLKVPTLEEDPDPPQAQAPL